MLCYFFHSFNSCFIYYLYFFFSSLLSFLHFFLSAFLCYLHSSISSLLLKDYSKELNKKVEEAMQEEWDIQVKFCQTDISWRKNSIFEI